MKEAAYASCVVCESTKSMSRDTLGRSINVQVEKLLHLSDPGAIFLFLILYCQVLPTVYMLSKKVFDHLLQINYVSSYE